MINQAIGTKSSCFTWSIKREANKTRGAPIIGREKMKVLQKYHLATLYFFDNPMPQKYIPTINTITSRAIIEYG